MALIKRSALWCRARALPGVSVIGRAGLFSLLLCSSGAGGFSPAQTPLFLGGSVAPNVMLMLDDSGSMDWEVLMKPYYRYCQYMQRGYPCQATSYPLDDGWPRIDYYGSRHFPYLYANIDNVYSAFDTSSLHGGTLERTVWSLNSFNDLLGLGDWRVFSSDANVMYFDPAREYRPWSAWLPNAAFTAARSHPVSSERGYGSRRNLTGAFYAVAIDDSGFSGRAPSPFAFNYRAGSNGLIDAWDSLTLYQIQAHTIDVWSVAFRPQGSEIRPSVVRRPSITAIAEVRRIQQNYANWYQYHRRRSFVVNSAVSGVIEQAPHYRYALGLINAGWLARSPVGDLASHNSNLLARLFAHDPRALPTPLRAGLNGVGSYLRQTTDQPGRPAPIQHSCQQNFSVLFTDGFWNGRNSGSIGDVDGDGYPFTLADHARYFYETDLRPDLDDRNPVFGADSPAWQHLSTFGVAFGVRGALRDFDGDGWPELGGRAPTINGAWGNPYATNAAKVDDLWHAAFNSKGLFAAASSPQDISQGLLDALAEVERRTGTASSVAANSGSVNTDTFLYQARFNSGHWTGDLWALPLNDPAGQTQDILPQDTLWKASSFFESSAFKPGTRLVLTADQPVAGGAVTGRPFHHGTAGNLSARYLSWLEAGMAPLGASGDAGAFTAALIDWLRGASAGNFSAYQFRQREGILGDLVHSDPVYVGAPSAFGPLYSSDAYRAFKAAHADRNPMIYVGGNDGMLHAFEGSSGQEKLAFIPATVVPELYKLADPDYSHRYFVDGHITVGDLCTGAGTCTWKSLLVGGLGAGGKGIYALDITDPDGFSAGKAGSIVRWELSSAEETSLGYTLGRASIVKLNNGKWGVILGNGYGSQDGRASLLVLDAETGRPLASGGRLTTNAASGNGLSSPAVVDIDGNGTGDYVYAGDLLGNLWKFDLRSADASQWGLAFQSGAGGVPLFAAGAGRPVTVMPQVGRHPTRGGRMIYFGTGKYLEAGDNSAEGQADQAFYGIRDDDSALQTAVTDADLLTQTIDQELILYPRDTNGDGQRDSQDQPIGLRVSSDHPICWTGCGQDAPHKGWRLLLSYGGNNRGERLITEPVLRNGRIVFATLQPSATVCEGGGRSWLMELDAIDGGLLSEPPFDLNGDRQFDFMDSHTAYSNGSASGGLAAGPGEVCSAGVCPFPSGIELSGVVQRPTVLDCGAGVECKYLSTSSGNVRRVNENPGVSSLGRQSWRQLTRDE